MGAHALLSASAAHRWLNCPPSVILTAGMPDKPSEYAAEGTLAHALCELKLRKKFTDKGMTTRKYNLSLKALKGGGLWQDEMETHSDAYIERISEIAMGCSYEPFIAAELRVDYSAWAQGGFGTADCVLIGDSTLHVIDFKYGKGVPVSADDNPQLKLYALGAYNTYSFLFPIRRIALHIVQPRLGSLSDWELSTEDLLAWGESIKPTAEQAIKGEGEYKSGGWCRFCKAAATCRKRAETNLLEDFQRVLPPLLSNDEVGEILSRAEGVKDWVEKIQDYALTEILRGGDIKGWKAVEGRSVRTFDDTDKAFDDIIAAGIDEPILYQRKPLTLAQVEKALGKKVFYEIAGHHVVTPKGKPTLAPATDKRMPYTTTAEDDFSSITDNENKGEN